MDLTTSDLEKDYYLGNYQSCINKASSMQTSRESAFYLCLSCYHLKKYDNLELELKRSSEPCFKIIRHLLESSKSEEGLAESTIKELEDLLDSKDDLSRLVISSIYMRQRDYSNAIRIVSSLNTLPGCLAQIGVYLAMNRLDLAEQKLKVMQSKDDFSTLTLLAMAQIKLASGRAREAYDIVVELEDKFRATPLLKNMQTVSAINKGELESAKEHCESALDLDGDNLEALINMVYILSNLRTTNDSKERHLMRIKAIDPNHDYIREFQKLEQELYS